VDAIGDGSSLMNRAGWKMEHITTEANAFHQSPAAIIITNE
jgi:hypothetical protein